MFTGREPFAGESLADSLGAVLEREPDWSILPPRLPPRIQLLMRRCLAKDRKQRLQHIGDVRIELEQAISDPAATLPDSPAGDSRSGKSRGGVLGKHCVLATALAAYLGWRLAHPVPGGDPMPGYHLTIPRTGGYSRGRTDDGDISTERTLSPDGTQMVYGWQDKLWLRSLADADPRPLEGSDGGHGPFWAPDSQSVAFFTEKQLRRISIFGGAAESICDVPTLLMNGSWAPDGGILIEIRGDPALEGLYLIRAGESRRSGCPDLVTPIGNFPSCAGPRSFPTAGISSSPHRAPAR